MCSAISSAVAAAVVAAAAPIASAAATCATPRADLEEAVRGTTVTIRVPTLVGCKICDGSGAKKGTSPVTCTTCGGPVRCACSRASSRCSRPALRCHGSGKMITDPRPAAARARAVGSKTLSVGKVPAGVDTGDRIRLSGEGEAGTHGGPPGDLYVVVSVREHSIFQRDGKHLYCEVPISFADAAGRRAGSADPGWPGQAEDPEGTQTGKLFRLRGRGVAPVRGGVRAT